MGCCIVSNPYDGIEEWFDVGKEVLVAKDGDQVQELYGWLLSDEEARLRMGEAARQKALQQHTHRHRAKEILNILKKP
jgi:spore maturation protein CgeB